MKTKLLILFSTWLTLILNKSFNFLLPYSAYCKRKEPPAICKCSRDSLKPFLCSSNLGIGPVSTLPPTASTFLAHQLHSKRSQCRRPWCRGTLTASSHILTGLLRLAKLAWGWHKHPQTNSVPPRKESGKMSSRPDHTTAGDSGCTVPIQKLHWGADFCCFSSQQPCPHLYSIAYRPFFLALHQVLAGSWLPAIQAWTR